MRNDNRWIERGSNGWARGGWASEPNGERLPGSRATRGQPTRHLAFGVEASDAPCRTPVVTVNRFEQLLLERLARQERARRLEATAPRLMW